MEYVNVSKRTFYRYVLKTPKEKNAERKNVEKNIEKNKCRRKKHRKEKISNDEKHRIDEKCCYMKKI